MHFSQSLPESWFKGLTAEYRTSGFKRGRKVSWWEQKKGEPNEPLDLSVYNLAAAFMLGLHRKSEHAWQLLRDRLVPVVGDLFEQPEHTVDVETGQPPEQAGATEKPPAATRPSPAPSASTAVVNNGRISLGGLRRGGK